jgi:hypothetical protein
MKRIKEMRQQQGSRHSSTAEKSGAGVLATR